MSDLLSEVLGAIGGNELGGPSQEQRTYLVQNHVEFPQGMGNRHVDEDGVQRANTIYVGPMDDTKSGTYARTWEFLLVDTQQTPVKGANGFTRLSSRRRMRAFTEAGDRDVTTGARSCESLNGVFPKVEFIGTEVVHPRTKQVVKVGYNPDGTPITDTVTALVDGQVTELPNICSTCPLGAWENGTPPPCEVSTRYILYIFKQGERGFLASLASENASVRIALEGVDAGKYGSRHDGAAFKGIRSVVTRKDTVDHVLKVAELGAITTPKVVAFSKTEKPDVASAPYGSDAFNQQLVEYADYNAIIRVSANELNPKGSVLETGMFLQHYPVVMSITRNNFGERPGRKPGWVPEFSIGTRELTAEEMVDYLEAVQAYYSGGTHLSMRGLANIEKLTEALLPAPAQAEAPQLPSTTDQPAVEAPIDGIDL